MNFYLSLKINLKVFFKKNTFATLKRIHVLEKMVLKMLAITDLKLIIDKSKAF